MLHSVLTSISCINRYMFQLTLELVYRRRYFDAFRLSELNMYKTPPAAVLRNVDNNSNAIRRLGGMSSFLFSYTSMQCHLFFR